jgi:simple sugar transport system permease protein
MFIFAIIFSGILGMIAGVLRALLNVNEILVTLMLNYISILLVFFFVYGPWKGKDNFPYTEYFPDFTFMPTLFSSRLHIGIFVTLIIGIILYLILKKTIWGYQIRIVGESKEAAKYAGIPVRRNIILVLTISGIIAGLGGVFEVSGLQHRLQPSISQGYGFTGIIVAWLAKNNMMFVLIVSFFIAGLFVAGEELQMIYKMPASIVKVFQGIILLCVLGGDIFIENKLIWEKSNA